MNGYLSPNSTSCGIQGVLASLHHLVTLWHLGYSRIYFGHIIAAIIEFSLFSLGTFLTSTVVGAVIGIPMLVIWFVMWVLDAIRIPGWVLNHNLRAREINYR